jgi:hypothetical protein
MFISVDPIETPMTLLSRRLRRWAGGGSLAFIVACGLMLSSVCPPACARAATPEKPADPASPAAPPAAIDGFRDAHFGMNEEEVRRAIRKDFPRSAAKLKKMIHPAEKTTVLWLPVQNLIPDTGVAQVSFILGYKSKTLMQVNILWRSTRSEDSDQTVVGAANSLRDYLKARSYKPGSEVVNRRLGNNEIVVFRGADAQDRTVLVVLSGGVAAKRKGKKALPALTLELSYIADPAHPDVFRIGKGQF